MYTQKCVNKLSTGEFACSIYSPQPFSAWPSSPLPTLQSIFHVNTINFCLPWSCSAFTPLTGTKTPPFFTLRFNSSTRVEHDWKRRSTRPTVCWHGTNRCMFSFNLIFSNIYLQLPSLVIVQSLVTISFINGEIYIDWIQPSSSRHAFNLTVSSCKHQTYKCKCKAREPQIKLIRTCNNSSVSIEFVTTFDRKLHFLHTPSSILII